MGVEQSSQAYIYVLRDDKLSAYTTSNSYSRSVSSGNWGTICLPYDVTNPEGADFYSIAGKRVDGSDNPTSLVLEAVEGGLEAGKPYIFQAKGSTLSATYTGTFTSAGDDNGLIGALFGTSVATGMYLLSNNQIVFVGSNGGHIAANRAYINMNTEGGVPLYNPSQGAPGRIVEIPLAPTTPTDLSSTSDLSEPVKFFKDGAVYILRDGVTYDALGRIVK